MIFSSCCDVWFCVVLLQRFVFRLYVMMFYLCVRDSYRLNIFDQIEITNHIMFVCCRIRVIVILVIIILSNL